MKRGIKRGMKRGMKRRMKRGMTIEYLKYIADLNFEVDFGANDAIGTIVTKWDLILFG